MRFLSGITKISFLVAIVLLGSVLVYAATSISNPLCSLQQVSNYPVNQFYSTAISGDGSRAAVSSISDGEYTEILNLNTNTVIDTLDHAGFPVLDYDGSRIAFYSDADLTGGNADLSYELFLWNNGTISQLTSLVGVDTVIMPPDISDNGRTIVFSVDPVGNVLSYNEETKYYVWREGIGVQALFGGAAQPATSTWAYTPIRVSADGNYAIFLHDAALTPDTPASGLGHVYRINIVSQSIEYLFSRESGAPFGYVSINADASRIAFDNSPNYPAFFNGSELWIWDEEDGFRIVNNGSGSPSFAVVFPMGFSADGSRLLFSSSFDHTGENPDGSVDYFIYEYPDNSIRQMSSRTGMPMPYSANDGLSANGARAAILLPTGTDYAANSYNYIWDTELYAANCSRAYPSPTSLQTTAVSPTSITLAWIDNASDESGFRLERSVNGTSNWSEIASLSVNASSYNDTGLSCSTSYHYRLRAIWGGSTYSQYSNVLGVTTSACPSSPNAPDNLHAATISATSIGLAWDDNASDETAYYVERSNTGGTSWSQIASLASNASSYTDSVSCGSEYQYRVRVYRGGSSGYTAYSEVITVTAPCATAIPPTPPLAPSNLLVSSVGRTTVILRWNDNASDESNYSIERSSDNGANWTEVGYLSSNSITFTSSGLICESNYQYRVRAYKQSGSVYSAYSNIVNASTSLCFPPPSNLRVYSTSRTNITLRWDDNSTDENQYRVERSSDGGASWTEIAQLSASSTGYSNNSLTCSSNYHYRVRAYRSSGASYSAYSNVLSANTDDCLPILTVPTNLQIIGAMETSISLSWNDTPDETAYFLERSLNGGSWIGSGNVGANVTSHTFIGMECGSNYQFRIRSYRSTDGWYSEYSEIAEITSPACTEVLPPSNLRASSVTASVAVLAWDDNANETRYYLERSEDGGTSWTQAGNFIAENIVGYTNSALNCETNYQYRIRGWRSDFAYSDYSTVLSITTGACPLAPSNLHTTGNTPSTISLAWDINASDATKHQIAISVDNGLTWVVLSNEAAMPANTYINHSRNCDTSYQYRVRAYRSADNSYSAYSNTITAVSGACPNAPTNLRATGSTHMTISVAWDDTNTDESWYMVELSEDGINFSSPRSVSANLTSYTAHYLSCGENTYVRVRAMRRINYHDDYSPYSEIIQTATAPCPLAPSNLVATTITAKSITVGWIDNATDESGYRMYTRASDGSWDLDWLSSNSSSYTLSNLSCGKSYEFRVRAFIGDTNYIQSAYSDTLIVSTSPCPTAPTNLLVTAFDENSVSLSWDDNADSESNYILSRGTQSNVFPTAYTLLSNTSSYTNVNLDCNTTYYYKVTANQTGVGTSVSNTVQVTTAPCLTLIAPSNLSATGIGPNSLTLLWDEANSDEDSVLIERSSDNGASWEVFDSVYNITNYPIFNYTTCNTVYNFRLRAHRDNDGAYSPYSDVLTVTTTACLDLTSPVLNFSFKDSTSMSMHWDDINYDESYFELEYSADGISWLSLFDEVHATSSSHTGLSCGQHFYYRVRAYRANDNSYSPYSNILHISMNACPLAPSYLRISSFTLSSVRIAWNDNASDESNYRIERSTDGGLTWIQVFNTPSNITSYQDSDISCGSSYKYRVRAYRISGTAYSTYSNILTVVPSCLPAAPSNLMIIGQGASNINLAWTDNASDESNYRIYRSMNGGSFSLIATLSANVSAYNDTGLSCASRYSYRVQAYRSSDALYGESSISNIYTSSCSAVPANLRLVSNNPTSVVLAWDDNGDESSFRLERSTDAGLNWTLIASPIANSTGYDDTTIICGQAMQYRIRAYQSLDNSYSGYSNILSVTVATCPPVNAPTNLVQTSATETTVTISWTDNASDETHYRVEMSNDNGVLWGEIGGAITSNTFTNIGTSCGTSAQYRVRAYRGLDNSYSAYSNVLTASSASCPVAAPSGSQVSSSQFTLSLAWTDNASNESDFELQRQNSGVWQTIANLPANTSSFDITGLACQTSYQHRIRAYRLSTGVYSSWLPLNGSTSSCPGLVAASLGSTSSENSISLYWTPDQTAQQHTLSYSNGVQWFNLGTFSPATSSFTHNSLACGQSYQYRISSHRAQDNATILSNTIGFATASCPALAAPSTPIILNSQSSLVSLQIPALPAGATSMSLERSLDGISWFGIGFANGSFLDVNVVCATSYHYRLVAYRASDGQYSPASASVSTTTPACPVAVSMILGAYSAGSWSFVDSNATANPASSFNFGDASWQALVGDWDGDGVDGIGLYREGEFILRSVVGGVLQESRFNFGESVGFQAVAGDWNGDGVDSIGLYGNGQFMLSDDNVNVHYRFNLGDSSGWQAIAGDWDGNAADGVALYKEGNWLLVDSVLNPATQAIAYGPAQAGWLPIAGDWNGDGIDTIGLYNNGVWRIRLVSNTGGAESSFVFGTAGAVPLSTFEGGIPNGIYSQEPFIVPEPEPEITPEITPES